MKVVERADRRGSTDWESAPMEWGTAPFAEHFFRMGLTVVSAAQSGKAELGWLAI
jgi:hypothetical protein